MPFDIDNPVETRKYEHSGMAFLYVLGEPVYYSRDVEDIELMASNLRELFARYRQELGASGTEMLEAFKNINKLADWGHCDACDAISTIAEATIAKAEKEQPAKCGYCHRPAEHDGAGGPKCTYCDDMLANC